jgi:hypothetical protein|tara:strand:+ start:1955 stop:2140 length:186 start_codon:yes stop_codon:yes gene_type:complete
MSSLFKKKQVSPTPQKTFVDDIKDTFNEKKIYRARWVWYHTILAGELFLIIILLIAILAKI